MAEILKLGMIGMSEGNGHPYSWSAIFNGYNREEMKHCPFPVIPDYLSRQHFPEDGLSHLGKVTHIWTQDTNLSKQVAASAYIEHVSEQMEDMIGKVDAILLARDDANRHVAMAVPFLKAGLPVFVDKPFALSIADANEMLSAQQYKNQVFTCSSLRYAKELLLTEEERNTIGNIYHVEGSVMKKWDTYSPHIIDPVLRQTPGRGALKNVNAYTIDHSRFCTVEWENLSAFFKVTGDKTCPLEIRFFGDKGNVIKKFSDSFSCFRASLEMFVKIIRGEEENIDEAETMEAVTIIEKGRIA